MILGISAYYHDSAAALVDEGKVIATVEEERFTRIKHDSSFPRNAVAYCLKEAGIISSRIANVIYYDKPILHLERLMDTTLKSVPNGLSQFEISVPRMIEKLKIKSAIKGNLPGYDGKVLFSSHHLSHAASTYYPSPFDSAAVIVADGVGEWATTSIGVGEGNSLKLLKEIRFPHSIGLLYSAFTYYLGFKVNSGEYKVMGLAPYGKPIYYDLLSKLITVNEDGSFVMDMKYFNYCQGLTMTSTHFHNLFGGPPRDPESPLTQKHKDLAASIQKLTGEIMLKIASFVRKETGEENLCLAGGVALNCVANGLIHKSGIFKRIFVQPAAGDAGGALGAALMISNNILGKPRQKMNVFSGPKYDRDEIMSALSGHNYTVPENLFSEIAQYLEAGKVVGLFQGRMEFGPRALGSRSILADPRDPQMRDRINKTIKFREDFRPFGACVLVEDCENYFGFVESPYMSFVTNVKTSELPAVTHVDGSCRVQTVDESNPFLYKLLRVFKERTGCGVLINTSFNIRGEPIVCTPQDAVGCFLKTGMDTLAIEEFILSK